jgi:hypothetical protein
MMPPPSPSCSSRRALGRLQVALEHPVAELALHAADAAEEAAVDHHLQLAQARQEQLVLHHAGLDAAPLRQPRDLHRILEVVGRRLLAIDVLAGVDRFGQQPGAQLRRRRVEEELVLRVGQAGVEVGGNAADAMRLGQRLQLLAVAADQHGVGHDPVAIGQHHAAILADRGDGADQVLVHPHPAGDAVHDEADAAFRHGGFAPFRKAGCGGCRGGRRRSCGAGRPCWRPAHRARGVRASPSRAAATAARPASYASADPRSPPQVTAWLLTLVPAPGQGRR